MKTKLIAVVATAAAALTLAGCGTPSTPAEQPTITVPDELTPTNVPTPAQKVDAACAQSWVKFERALTQFDAASAQAAQDAGVTFEADDPFAVAADEPGAADYYTSLSAVTAGVGEAVVAIAADVENTRVKEALTGIGDGHVDSALFLATYTSPETSADDLARFQDDYNATASAMFDYASLCGETLSGGTSNS